MNIIIDDGKLKREVYRFIPYSSTAIVLNSYSFEERTTTRHKFKNIKHYDRHSNRYTNIDVNDIPRIGSIVLVDMIKEYILNNLKITWGNKS